MYYLHVGKDDSLDGTLGMTAAVVLRLVEPICGLGHHIYMDNLYTSPALFTALQSHGFGACGTLRLNRRGIPPEAKGTLRKGATRVIRIEEGIKVVQWHDKRVVSLLSTLHDDSPVAVERRSRRAVGGREVVEKPEAIVEYNKYMGGVDRGDQLLTYYGYPHRTVKWWRRAFFFLFDAAVVNSYIMYCQQYNGRRLTHEQYRIELAKNLLKSANTPVPSTDPPHGPRLQLHNPLSRLTGRHFPGQLEKSAAGHQTQRDCTVCSRRKGRGRKPTTFFCKECDVPLCVVPCFELYHTKVDPQRYL